MGHISLSAFNARALSDVAAAVREAEAAGAAELVLDLRDNRGGLVQEGIEIAKLFLDGAGLSSSASLWHHCVSFNRKLKERNSNMHLLNRAKKMGGEGTYCETYLFSGWWKEFWLCCVWQSP